MSGTNRGGRWLLVIGLATAVALAVIWSGRWKAGSRASARGVSVAKVLGRDAASGFEPVTGPRAYRFPEDHGPHPEQQIEWWYFTGNVADESGRRFGFQLTFFRIGLDPDAPERESRWGARDAWMAHFTVSDAAGGTFRAFERLSRGALGLAGAESEPFRVWTESWRAESVGEDLFPMRLHARDGEIALDVILRQDKPLVLQGDRGYSEKGPEPGNASHYLAFTRLAAEGGIETGGARHAVSGAVWMDHEWSTSVLSPDVVGWDWFSLQLDDGRDLMLYSLRRRDGSSSPFSAGALIDSEGRVTRLAGDAFEIDVLERWTSPESGVTYPSSWRLTAPDHDLALDVRPLLAGQELRVSATYWEGAVEARGEGSSGRGYVELVGYDEAGRE